MKRHVFQLHTKRHEILLNHLRRDKKWSGGILSHLHNEIRNLTNESKRNLNGRQKQLESVQQFVQRQRWTMQLVVARNTLNIIQVNASGGHTVWLITS
uniref:Uncharacterized protein n=1 Tax=viral metagenome TaxID=1070528 RepID=A0A6C0I4G1_9ZZZZ